MNKSSMQHKQNYKSISGTLAGLAFCKLYQQNHQWYNSCVEGGRIEGKVTRMIKQKLDDITNGTLAGLALHCSVAGCDSRKFGVEWEEQF
jgi:hypothetical protein